ncbi:thioredoxin family protein [Granulicella cerasi]|uniref:Thioredoxin family protein n=2 Tax=Granulicella cerasi TaxID=741063 RepID=A0ABW1Z740_9BACT|nr:thioredoxin family protein [Granulicella cerasi]
METSVRTRIVAASALFGTILAAAACSPLGTSVHAAQQLTPEQRKAMHQPVIHPQPRHIYPDTTAAAGDLQAALKKAKAEHKRVIVDFGGDWCGDCQVLDVYFNQAPNDALLAKYFVKVNVNIGHEDANLDIAKRFGMALKGVPALAVLDARGKVLYAQGNEFSDMRYMEAQSVTDFLNKWKA